MVFAAVAQEQIGLVNRATDITNVNSKESKSAGAANFNAMNDVKQQLRAQYGEKKKITDGNYDKSLSVKCVNGTFVGKRTENIVAYRGIPFAGKPPVGELRWKAPVDVVPDEGVYEAYYNAKSAYGNEELETGSLFYQDEDCLYLNIWKAE
ncbi:MAG: carboxylesterase family protein, partial [Selenomonadaceae bacterium]|nr:carboxylesterase family protein [Selenomonadaceae bacterium]